MKLQNCLGTTQARRSMTLRIKENRKMFETKGGPIGPELNRAQSSLGDATTIRKSARVQCPSPGKNIRINNNEGSLQRATSLSANEGFSVIQIKSQATVTPSWCADRYRVASRPCCLKACSRLKGHQRFSGLLVDGDKSSLMPPLHQMKPC